MKAPARRGTREVWQMEGIGDS